jgi:hypothetical protein
MIEGYEVRSTRRRYRWKRAHVTSHFVLSASRFRAHASSCICQQKQNSTMWLAGAPEYIFGLSLGVVALIISRLLLIPPHPSPVFERRPNPPRSPSPEAPAIIEPYDEDEIVSAMKAIYDILIQLDQITPDQLVYPPASGHSINTELCESLNLEPAVISLMKRLTYPKVYKTLCTSILLKIHAHWSILKMKISRLHAILKMGTFRKL